MHSLYCENEFYLHENEKSFPYQRLSTSPRFDKETRGNSEMAYEIKMKICLDKGYYDMGVVIAKK